MHETMLLLDAAPVRQMNLGVTVLDNRRVARISAIACCSAKLARTRSAKWGSEIWLMA